jgi:hypothetical protein
MHIIIRNISANSLPYCYYPIFCVVKEHLFHYPSRNLPIPYLRITGYAVVNSGLLFT